MNDDATDEDELLAQVAGGDMRALEALYRRMRVQVFAFALAVTGDRATSEDVMQDTFVRVYSGAPGYRPQARARAWVLTIARHLALDAVRRRTREPVSGMADHSAAAPPGEPDRIGLDVVNALLQLGEVDRRIVVLHNLAGLTHSQVAAELELPPGTVRWRYRVALARLRPLVEVEVLVTEGDLKPRMWRELSGLAEDRWPAIRRAVAARVAADLLAQLDRPPPPASRLHRERQLRAERLCHREVA